MSLCWSSAGTTAVHKCPAQSAFPCHLCRRNARRTTWSGPCTSPRWEGSRSWRAASAAWPARSRAGTSSRCRRRPLSTPTAECALGGCACSRGVEDGPAERRSSWLASATWVCQGWMCPAGSGQAADASFSPPPAPPAQPYVRLPAAVIAGGTLYTGHFQQELDEGSVDDVVGTLRKLRWVK